MNSGSCVCFVELKAWMCDNLVVDFTDTLGIITPTGPTGGPVGMQWPLIFNINSSSFASNLNPYISVNVSGGFTPYSFSWTGPNSFSASTPGIFGTDNEEYCVIVTDDLNCVDTLCITPICDTSSCPIECQADSSLNVSTAYDNANQTLYPTTNSPSFISTDPNWILVWSPDLLVNLNGPAYVIAPNPIAWHIDNDAGWISPYDVFNNAVTPQINNANQIIDTSYTFRNCFCLCEADSITIDLLVSADNYAEISLLSDFQTTNEVLTGIGQLNSSTFPNSNFFAQTPMLYNTYLNAGKHCLIAELYNKDVGESLGLKVEGHITSKNGEAVEKYTCCDPNIYISGTKWIDADCDGIGDSYGAGWTINLYDISIK